MNNCKENPVSPLVVPAAKRTIGEESILIVDDNPVNLKLAQVLLEGEGYQVQTSEDAEEALKLLESFHPRLILMDIQLPGMDGLELTRRLKASADTQDIAILALTAYVMKGDEEKTFAAGCDGYISKPINTRTFVQAVAGHLGKNGRHDP